VPEQPAHDRAGRGTRDAILEIAARSFADNGYRGTRLHAIAEQVGIQKASIFHHFTSKEHLYRAVLEQGRGQTEAIIECVLGREGGWLERARGMLEAYVDLVSAHPEQTRILLRQSLGDAPEGYVADHEADRLVSLVTSFIADGQRAGAFAPLDGLTLLLGVVGMVAFLFTSATIVAPRWAPGVGAEDRGEHIRRHVVTVIERALVHGAARNRGRGEGGGAIGGRTTA
jgi:AcrR family transcriptional regulator